MTGPGARPPGGTPTHRVTSADGHVVTGSGRSTPPRAWVEPAVPAFLVGLAA
ncbi:hypothetical protein [Tsukamurella soli]|uniref:hypothetical protein n=1 Tax=Tsukamurella soli TaxID=644556 RepID=UPI0031EBA065